MPNQVRVGVGVTGAKGAGSELDRFRDKFDKLQKQGAKGFAIGAGVAATGLAFDALGQGISAVTGFLSDSAAAFRENEVSVSQLGAALRANVEGWDGNTQAIEAAITKPANRNAKLTRRTVRPICNSSSAMATAMIITRIRTPPATSRAAAH